MILIAAGTAEQAKIHAQQYELPRDGWQYVADSQRIRGVSRDSELRIVGTFWRRRDAQGIIDSAIARGLKVYSEVAS